MDNRKRHHFLPEYYLKGFADPGKPGYLWIYEKGKSTVRSDRPKNTAVVGHYYSAILPDGSKDSSLELYLSDEVEAPGNRVIDSINRREPLTRNDKHDLARYLAAMYVRTPGFRSQVELLCDELQKNRVGILPRRVFDNLVRHLALSGSDTFAPIDPKWNELPEESAADEESRRQGLSAFDVLDPLAEVFSEMGWRFFSATRRRKYVTSDTPVWVVDPTFNPASGRGINIRLPTAEVTFPISQEVVLVCRWLDSPILYKESSDREVDEMNMRTAGAAVRYVYGPANLRRISHILEKYPTMPSRQEVERVTLTLRDDGHLEDQATGRLVRLRADPWVRSR